MISPVQRPMRSIGKRQLAVLAISDAKRGIGPSELAEALTPHSVFILRDYDLSDRAVLARSLGRRCRLKGIGLIIAGDPELARRAGALGLHCPSWLLARGQPIRYRLGRRLIFAAVHDRGEMLRALRIGVDGVLLSPVFPTASHPKASPLGPIRAARIAGLTPIAVYALGGVSDRTIGRLSTARFEGVAGVSLIRTLGLFKGLAPGASLVY